ncbi:hypothetical protein [Haliangium sp.]|uniref:hypothetical protein n=1 Tax=Haliangium sp. TaxID=2663208 RepID=UPI003D0E60F2
MRDYEEPFPWRRAFGPKIRSRHAAWRGGAESLDALHQTGGWPRTPDISLSPRRGEPPRETLRALRAEIRSLREEQRRLHERLGELARIVHDGQFEDMAVVPMDPHTAWIQRNLETLAAYPNEWIALDEERGILFHSADADTFAAMIDALTEEELERVLAFNTVMYL